MNDEITPLEPGPAPLATAWDMIQMSTADMFAARAKQDEAWQNQAVASVRSAGLARETLLWWLTMARYYTPDRMPLQLPLVDRTGTADGELAKTPHWWPSLVLLLAEQDRAEAYPLARALRALDEVEDRALDSLLLTVGSAAWEAFDRVQGPLPGGAQGVALSTLRWCSRLPAWKYFVSDRRQVLLRLSLQAERVAAVVGVDYDRGPHDPVSHLSILVGHVMTGATFPIPPTWEDLGELVRLAAAVLALESPALLVSDHWPLRLAGEEPAVYLLGCAPPPDASPRTRGALELLELTRTFGRGDGCEFEERAAALTAAELALVLQAGAAILAELTAATLEFVKDTENGGD